MKVSKDEFKETLQFLATKFEDWPTDKLVAMLLTFSCMALSAAKKLTEIDIKFAILAFEEVLREVVKDVNKIKDSIDDEK